MESDPMLRLDGIDSDFLYASVRSRSRPEEWHTVALCRRSWVLSCTCEDCTYRKRQTRFHTPGGCWHIGIVRAFVRRFLPPRRGIGED